MESLWPLGDLLGGLCDLLGTQGAPRRLSRSNFSMVFIVQNLFCFSRAVYKPKCVLIDKNHAKMDSRESPGGSLGSLGGSLWSLGGSLWSLGGLLGASGALLGGPCGL